jgi:hypothetical protein
MFPLLLALVAINPAPADEWRVSVLNPAYEVYGHMDRGVFRYTQSRPRAAARAIVTPNYGLSLPKHAGPVLGDSDFEVRGTDPVLTRVIAESLAEKDRAFHQKQAAPKGPIAGEAAPCPGPCPTPNRPAPRPPHVPNPVPAIERDFVLIAIVAVLGTLFAFFIVALKLVLLFLLVRWIYRKLTEPPASPTP